jgi:hypothetical protein
MLIDVLPRFPDEMLEHWTPLTFPVPFVVPMMSCGELMPPPTPPWVSFGCVLPSSPANALVAVAMARRTTANNFSECLLMI